VNLNPLFIKAIWGVCPKRMGSALMREAIFDKYKVGLGLEKMIADYFR